MSFAAIRAHALSLPEVTEAPHHHLSSFRVRGRIFATFPAEDDHLRVFLSDDQREHALAVYPEFVDKLLWGGKVVGLRVALASAPTAAVKALIDSAWAHQSAKAGGGKAGSRRGAGKA